MVAGAGEAVSPQIPSVTKKFTRGALAFSTLYPLGTTKVHPVSLSVKVIS